MIPQPAFLRPLKQLLLLAISLLMLSTYSYADPRMVVKVTADEHGKVPAVQDAIQQALPMLWDRVVEANARASLSETMKAMPFLLRVVPFSDGVQVTFNPERVWQYLDQHQIAYLKEAPHLKLQIQMTNHNDASMPKTAEALQSYAESVAQKWGVVLDQSAPLLLLNWRWLDASQVYLDVQGSSALTAFSETRSLKAGDPLEQLQAWVEELLLKARDAHSDTAVPAATGIDEQKGYGDLGFILIIEQPAALPAQVALEDALRQDSRVKAVIPSYLSSGSRHYQVQLNSGDDLWVADWFRRRGMQATPVPGGWLVQ